MTAKGLFEARASEERDGTSQVNFYLNGKELKPTAASELRRETIQCSRKRGKLGVLDQFYAALSILRNSIISEAEAAKYVSSYKCTGSGTVEVVLVDTVDRTNGSTTYFFQFKQHGHVCGWAAYTA